MSQAKDREWRGRLERRAAVLVTLASMLAGSAHGQTAEGMAGSGDATAGVAAAASANPLAHIRIETLNATRERPLFLPTRRPPVVAPPPEPAAVAAPAAPPPPPPEPPRLTLIGVIASSNGAGVAVLRDETSREIIRLKPGDSRRGWLLAAVKPRSVVLRKDAQSVEVTILPPGQAPQSQPESL